MPHPALEQVGHRPWALPPGPWTWRQRWVDLLFAHWPVDAVVLRRLVPPPLRVQEFGGSSWVGLIPFRMSGVMRRPLPDLPWVSAFPELNVRVYVEHGGKPGVWFLSLDAANRLAVWAGRRFFHLPYHHADISIRRDADGFRYDSRRTDGRAALEAFYRPVSPPFLARPGTLEHWLTERYCLYAQAPDGSIVRNEVHHAPWPLQRAECSLTENAYLDSHGLGVSGPPGHLHFSPGVDVVVWDAEGVAAGTP